ncbi:hypothetical protein BS17DRAFT_770502 [Gyrodon lividus]|nr:hypothetical protein BS17DRAFT_770502 [Gyrodon lividus]
MASLSPPVYPGSSKLQWGLNHLVLASFLCPIVSLVEKLLSREINMSASILVAVLRNKNTKHFNKENMFDGLFGGFFLEWAHFGISSKSRWAETDSPFSYHEYYYTIMEIIEDCADPGLSFKDAKGRKADLKDNLDDHTTLGGPPKTFLAKMHAPDDLLPDLVPCDPVPRVVMITPLPNSPPHSNCSPSTKSALALVCKPPSIYKSAIATSQGGPSVFSDLSDIKDEVLEDVTNVKSKSSAKKRASMKKGKLEAVPRNDEDGVQSCIWQRTTSKEGKR